MYWKSKTLLAKPEATYGVDAVPTGGANAILATNVSLSPMEGQDESRNLETPYFGASEEIPVGLYSTLTFDVELAASGTAGTAPAWGPLIRMCGAAETIVALTSVEYDPITDDPESGSIYFAIDTVRHVLLGGRGTFVIKVNAQGIPVLNFTMTGLFALPTTEAKVTPDFSAFQNPKVATNTNTPTFTIGGTDFILRSFEFNLANEIQQRLLIGYEGIHIVDRDERLKATIEATALATYNPFAIAQNQTKQAIQLIHGTVAGNIVQFDFDQAQQKRPSGYSQEQNVLEWPLEFIPLPASGDDQWKITLT
ncbi:MAG: hypothetical protein KUG65_13175 [Sphingomonadaceae bacterium]|nr:hypothetical protein [Sphingomonadaceae bacterium]